MDNPITIIFCVVLSIALAEVSSRWIDQLYSRADAPLEFHARVSARSRFRRPLLSIGVFLSTVMIVERPMPEAIFLSLAAFMLLSITATDFEQYVIFDRMTLPLALVGVVAAVRLGLPLEERLIASAIGGGVFIILVIVTRGAIGGGDIKLIAALGLWLGDRLLDVVTYGAIFGGVAAFLMLVTGVKDRKSVFAYGPYFALTALVELLTTYR